MTISCVIVIENEKKIQKNSFTVIKLKFHGLNLNFINRLL